MYLCLGLSDLKAPHRHGKYHGRVIVHEVIIKWKGSTGIYVKIAVDHTTNLLRRVFSTYRLHDRLPTYAKRRKTNEVA